MALSISNSSSCWNLVRSVMKSAGVSVGLASCSRSNFWLMRWLSFQLCRVSSHNQLRGMSSRWQMYLTCCLPSLSQWQTEAAKLFALA